MTCIAQVLKEQACSGLLAHCEQPDISRIHTSASTLAAAAVMALVNVSASEGGQPVSHARLSSLTPRSLLRQADSFLVDSSAPLGTILEAGILHTARLVPVRGMPAANDSSSSDDSIGDFDDNGLTVITGGLGGLGMLTACWLTQQKAGGRILLLGRSGRSSSVESSLETLMSTSEVTLGRRDVGDSAEADGILGSLRDQGCKIGRVIHAGGVLRDGLLINQTLAGGRPEQVR